MTSSLGRNCVICGESLGSLSIQIRSADEPETIVKSCLKCGTVGNLCTRYSENNYMGIKDVPTLTRDHDFIAAQTYRDYRLTKRRDELSSACGVKGIGKGSRSLQSLIDKGSLTNTYLPELSVIKFESCLVLKCSTPLDETESKDLITGNKGLKCVVNFKLEVLKVIWTSSETGSHGTSSSVLKEGVVIVSKDFRLFILGDLNHEVKTLSDCRVGLQLECVGSISRVISTENVVCDYWCDTESVRIKCHNVSLHVGSYLELRNHPSMLHSDFPVLSYVSMSSKSVKLHMLEMINFSCVASKVLSEVHFNNSSKRGGDLLCSPLSCNLDDIVPMDGERVKLKLRRNLNLMRSCYKVEYNTKNEELVRVCLRSNFIYILRYYDNTLMFLMPACAECHFINMSAVAICRTTEAQEGSKRSLNTSIVAITEAIKNRSDPEDADASFVKDAAFLSVYLKLSFKQFSEEVDSRVLFTTDFNPHREGLLGREGMAESKFSSETSRSTKSFYVFNKDFRNLLTPYARDFPKADISTIKNLYAHVAEIMLPTPMISSMSSIKDLNSEDKKLLIVSGAFLSLTKRITCSVLSSFVLMLNKESLKGDLKVVNNYDPYNVDDLGQESITKRLMSCSNTNLLLEVKTFCKASRGPITFLTSDIEDLKECSFSTMNSVREITLVYLGVALSAEQRAWINTRPGIKDVTKDLFCRPPFPWVLDTSVPPEMEMCCYCTNDLASAVGLY